MEGKWVKLVQKGSVPGARSSHAVAVVGTKAYVFGGEFTPRVPVDNKLHAFDLRHGVWSAPKVAGDIPPPRVGVTMTAIGDIIYVFGGRDADHKELNELFSFDTRTNEWLLLSSTAETGPPHRSYHSMAADDRRIYIFGGCGNGGRRLNDLWAYDTADREWIELPSAGEKCRPRGGAGLAVSAGKVWVVYGFSGSELDDVHAFDIARKEWSVVDTAGDEKPSGRSVFSTVSIGGKYVFIYGGEIDPSDLGHLGAGKFDGEVYGLDTETCRWIKVSGGGAGGGGGENPGRRGWCAFSAAEIDGEKGMFVYGGNSSTNDRLDDIFFFVPCI